MLDAVVSNPNKTLSTAWHGAYSGVLDTYLGTPVEKFDYEGKSYTPIEFRDHLGLNPENYVTLTSFTHHPYYSEFISKYQTTGVMEYIITFNWMN